METTESTDSTETATEGSHSWSRADGEFTPVPFPTSYPDAHTFIAVEALSLGKDESLRIENAVRVKLILDSLHECQRATRFTPLHSRRVVTGRGCREEHDAPARC